MKADIKLKELLSQYEQGQILSEKTKKDIDTIKSESLTQIKELRNKLEELTSNNAIKLKEYEGIISSANIELSQKKKSIEEYESIALKQEDKIEKLNTHIYELNKSIFHKDLSMKQNETYSNQLINIVNEYKLQIKKLKEQKIQEENEEIALLKRQNKNLQNELEIEQKIIQNIKKNHENLQGKYLTICYNVKKKEQDELLRQAKYLSKENLTKKFFNKNYKILTMNRSSSVSSIIKGKLNLAKNKRCVNSKRKNEDLNLPEINFGNKSFINGEINKSFILNEGNKQNNDNDYRKNMDEINEKLKQIIDEN